MGWKALNLHVWNSSKCDKGFVQTKTSRRFENRASVLTLYTMAGCKWILISIEKCFFQWCGKLENRWKKVDWNFLEFRKNGVNWHSGSAKFQCRSILRSHQSSQSFWPVVFNRSSSMCAKAKNVIIPPHPRHAVASTMCGHAINMGSQKTAFYSYGIQAVGKNIMHMAQEKSTARYFGWEEDPGTRGALMTFSGNRLWFPRNIVRFWRGCVDLRGGVLRER